jgi:sirohydrochlorin ferrochelatase
MQALLVVAHGSRRAASNQEIFDLIDILSTKTTHYISISAAFLELATPSISEGVDFCVKNGATEVVVLPYFLSAGRHVSEDIENALAPKRLEYPQLTITIKPHIGAANGMAEMLLNLAKG